MENILKEKKELPSKKIVLTVEIEQPYFEGNKSYSLPRISYDITNTYIETFPNDEGLLKKYLYEISNLLLRNS